MFMADSFFLCIFVCKLKYLIETGILPLFFLLWPAPTTKEPDAIKPTPNPELEDKKQDRCAFYLFMGGFSGNRMIG